MTALRPAQLVVVAVLLAAIVAPAASSAAPGAATLSWKSVELPLPANAATNPRAVAGRIVCPAAGECSAVGGYLVSSERIPAVLWSESNGVWHATAAKLPADAAGSDFAEFEGLACLAPGRCVAVGSYDRSGTAAVIRATIAFELHGTWGSATPAPVPPDANAAKSDELEALACPARGSCAAVGTYTDKSGKSQGVLLQQSGGAWKAAKLQLPKGAAESTFFTTIACVSAGNCTAAGTYTDLANQLEAMVVTESAGHWQPAVAISLPAGAATSGGQSAYVTDVSCSAPGECKGVGDYRLGDGSTRGFIVRERKGVWGTAKVAPLPAGAAQTQNGAFPFSGQGLSCVGVSPCAAVGLYVNSGGRTSPLLLGQNGGSWAARAVKLPADAAGSPGSGVGVDVDCPDAGDCMAVGQYLDKAGDAAALVLVESGGIWAAGIKAPLPANAVGTAAPATGSRLSAHSSYLRDVSCVSAGNCAMTGGYADTSNRQEAFVLTSTPG